MVRNLPKPAAFSVLGLALITLLVASACAPPQAAVTVKETVVVEKVVTPTAGPAVYRGYTFTGQRFADGTTVTYMAGMSPDQLRALREDAAWLKQATNIDLRFELGDDAKFNALLAAGNPPDLYYCDTPGIRAADGTFMPINDYVDDAFLGRFPKGFVDGFTGLDDKLYSLQLGGWFPVVLVNTKLLKEAGADMPAVDWTWDDVVKIGQKVTKDSNGKTPLDADFDPQKTDTWGIHMGWFSDDILPFSNGANRADETGTKLQIDDPAFVAAWKWWSDLYNTYRIQPPPAWFGAQGKGAGEVFLAGKLAMYIEGIDYDLFRRANDALGEGNWAIVGYPRPADKELVLARYQGGACVSSKSKDPAAAVEALKFLATAGFVWYPSMWLNDVDYTGYWEGQYPFLKAAGYREAMAYSLPKIGPDPWHWKATPFDVGRYTEGWDFGQKWGQVQDGKLPFDQFDFAAYAKQANESVVKGMERDLAQTQLLPAWKEALEKVLAERKAELDQ